MHTLTLMHMKSPVLEIDLQTGYVTFYNEQLLPFYLRGSLHKIGDLDYCNTQEVCSIAIRNVTTFVDYMTTRLRVYSSIRNVLESGVLTERDILIKLIDLTHAVGIDDFYWISPTDYKRVNKQFDVCKIDIYSTLEVTSLGVYEDIETSCMKRVCLDFDRREVLSDIRRIHTFGMTRNCIGMLRLYKLLGGCVAQQIVRLGGGKLETSRNCLSSCNVTFVPAIDYYRFCQVTDSNFVHNCLCIDNYGFCFLVLFDYLTGNINRRPTSWGFLYDINDRKFISLAPVIDCHGCFNTDDNIDNRQSPIVTDAVMLDAAKDAVQKLGIHCLPYVCPADFASPVHYKQFIERKVKLGIM